MFVWLFDCLFYSGKQDGCDELVGDDLQPCLFDCLIVCFIQENKMDVMNLSVIMTPNFMPVPKDEKEGKSSVGSQGEESKLLEKRTNVVAFLLNMAKK